MWLTGALEYLLEWEKLPHINLEAEWWNPGAAGFMFNKTISEDIQGDNTYDLVREGKWTLDKFCENSKKAIRCLNGNGEMDDEAQERYYSSSFGAEVMNLPITLPEDRCENVGMLLEAMNFASQQTVVPPYKEVVLKTKSARDDDSADMIDIVFESVTFDFGINAWQNQASSPLIQGVYSNRSGNVASTLASLKSSIEGTIEQLIETVSK